MTLIGIDASCAGLGWVTAAAIPTSWIGATSFDWMHSAAWVAALVVLSLVVNLAQHLYRSRVCGVHAVEYLRLTRTAGIAAIAALPLARLLGGDITLRRAALGGALALIAMMAGRMQFDDWLRSARRRGRFQRPVVVIGTGPEAQAFIGLLADHPDAGFDVVGVVGSSAHPIDGVEYLGSLADVHRILDGMSVASVMIASDAAEPEARDHLARDLVDAGYHVQLVGGLPGMAHRRLRVVPIAHTPTFYIERARLTRSQRAAKRAMDLVVASFAVVVLLPLGLAVALAIWLDDRGPTFFRQVRVGQDGHEFRVWKFRTMVRNAEQLSDELRAQNERSGPLFKLTNDPRRTRVGRVLEATSIDELPQLLNVLTGEMSLVGPRPALPKEVAQFDDGLRARLQVPPGVTGLWQVEARENPAFGAYRRLDLFYVENWSLGLDFAILAETVHAVAARVTRRKVA